MKGSLSCFHSCEPEGEVNRQPGDLRLIRPQRSDQGRYLLKDARGFPKKKINTNYRSETFLIVLQNWDDIFDDDFDELLTKPAEYWTGLMRTAFSGPRVRVKGIPSEEYR